MVCLDSPYPLSPEKGWGHEIQGPHSLLQIFREISKYLTLSRKPDSSHQEMEGQGQFHFPSKWTFSTKHGWLKYES